MEKLITGLEQHEIEYIFEWTFLLENSYQWHWSFHVLIVWFTECPNVRELHIELDEASQLLEASNQQYEEVLGIVQRHTDDTISWLSDMASDFGWVTELANNNTTPESIFSIATVSHQENIIVLPFCTITILDM